MKYGTSSITRLTFRDSLRLNTSRSNYFSITYIYIYIYFLNI